MSSFSPLRSTATFKPQAECPAIDIYACPCCGKSWQALGRGDHAGPICCGEAMERVLPVSADEAPEDYELRYAIVGGLNADAIQAFWRCPETMKLEWILLKTYTGNYLRYPTARKKPPMVFPMADEDAYVYCDKAVCERCTFKCKLGFVLYALFSGPDRLLLEAPLNQVADRFKTKLI